MGIYCFDKFIPSTGLLCLSTGPSFACNQRLNPEHYISVQVFGPDRTSHILDNAFFSSRNNEKHPNYWNALHRPFNQKSFRLRFQKCTQAGQAKQKADNASAFSKSSAWNHRLLLRQAFAWEQNLIRFCLLSCPVCRLKTTLREGILCSKLSFHSKTTSHFWYLLQLPEPSCQQISSDRRLLAAGQHSHGWLRLSLRSKRS